MYRYQPHSLRSGIQCSAKDPTLHPKRLSDNGSNVRIQLASAGTALGVDAIERMNTSLFFKLMRSKFENKSIEEVMVLQTEQIIFLLLETFSFSLRPENDDKLNDE